MEAAAPPFLALAYDLAAACIADDVGAAEVHADGERPALAWAWVPDVGEFVADAAAADSPVGPDGRVTGPFAAASAPSAWAAGAEVQGKAGGQAFACLAAVGTCSLDVVGIAGALRAPPSCRP